MTRTEYAGPRQRQVPSRASDPSAMRAGPFLSLALMAGAFASWVSRMTHRGAGAIIGGRVTLLLAPRALSRLARGRTIVLVSGTNGKTTTSHLLAAALRTNSAVAANCEGANMPDGLVWAMGRDRTAPVAVLEVDESYLPRVAAAVQPAIILLLNLSRDQLDRVSEVRQLEAQLRDCFSRLGDTLVIANADDILVSSAAMQASQVLWVAAGAPWSGDSGICPRCARPVVHSAESWSCACGTSRPHPAWVLDSQIIHTPDGRQLSIELQIPGRAARADAIMALAAAVELGISVGNALREMNQVWSINGRYQTARIAEHTVRLLLAKNPAGWWETLTLLDGGDQSVVLVVNGREADGRDLSWLWDVPFERLIGHQVAITGERRADLAVRLTYAGITFHQADDMPSALILLEPGSVDIIANYTPFLDISQKLNRDR
jgi:UDP-N-acetylmuramyl tripeptide synthase